jgi:hypothetical protein
LRFGTTGVALAETAAAAVARPAIKVRAARRIYLLLLQIPDLATVAGRRNSA